MVVRAAMAEAAAETTGMFRSEGRGMDMGRADPESGTGTGTATGATAGVVEAVKRAAAEAMLEEAAEEVVE